MKPETQTISKTMETRHHCEEMIASLSCSEQVDVVKNLILRLPYLDKVQISEFLEPLLKIDFISVLPANGFGHIAEKIFSYLDSKSISASELVCKDWKSTIEQGMTWKKLTERTLRSDRLWRGVVQRRGLRNFYTRPSVEWQSPINDSQFRRWYYQVARDVKSLKENWLTGSANVSMITSPPESVPEGVYCIQYDDFKIVSGQRDTTVKIWDRKTLTCNKVLAGHTGSVLALMFDSKIIISSSTDTTMRVWDVETGDLLNTVTGHSHAVLHVRFKDNVVVSCSKDQTIRIWLMNSPTDILLLKTLHEHIASVNVVDFDGDIIVSGSGDRTIKVWSASSGLCLKTLRGHTHGIACLQHTYQLIFSGSSDYTVRVWNFETGECLRVLKGHRSLVRCLRVDYDNSRIISGSYDGKIKIWDLKAVFDTKVSDSAICLTTLAKHKGKVFRLQVDDFTLVSCSQDGKILIWDFHQFDEQYAIVNS